MLISQNNKTSRTPVIVVDTSVVVLNIVGNTTEATMTVPISALMSDNFASRLSDKYINEKSIYLII